LKTGQSWLFVIRQNDPIPRNDFLAMTYANCLTPDYCVLPTPSHVHAAAAAAAPPRAIFLTRNKFCCGADSSVPGMFDVERLALLTQRDWFTVFRYERPGQPSWIVKLVVFSLFVATLLLWLKLSQAHLRKQRHLQVFAPRESHVQVDAAFIQQIWTPMPQQVPSPSSNRERNRGIPRFSFPSHVHRPRPRFWARKSVYWK
jgi:hypothetical protein